MKKSNENKRELCEQKSFDIYAVDFDGTLSLGAEWPQIGKPNMELIEFLKERKAAGDKIILWTCRSGNYLKTAVKVCNKYGLFFDAINDNVQENIKQYGNNTRKVYATYYIDDRNVLPFMKKTAGYLRVAN